MKPKIVSIIILSLVLIELVEITLSCIACGARHGILYALNDPGKTIFHLFLLPICFYVFARTIRNLRLVYNGFPKRHKIALGVFALSLLIAVGGIMTHEIESHCQIVNQSSKRVIYLLPHDIRDRSVRGSLIVLRDSITSVITAGDTTKGVNEMMKRYRNFLTNTVCDTRDNLRPFMIVNYLESALGIIFGAFTLFLLLLTIMAYQLIPTAKWLKEKLNLLINEYAVMGFILSTEILFRTYSDTYINFLTPSSTSLFGPIAIFIALVAFLMIYKFKAASTNRVGMFTIGYTVVAAVIAILANLSTTPINSIFKVIYTWDWLMMIPINIVVMIPLAFAIYLFTQSSTNKDTP